MSSSADRQNLNHAVNSMVINESDLYHARHRFEELAGAVVIVIVLEAVGLGAGTSERIQTQ